MPVDASAIAILSRLEERMAGLVNGARQVDAASPEETLQAILTETSDTILPRVLSFAADETIVRLMAANARIIRAETADGSLTWVKNPGEIAQSLKTLITSNGPISVSQESPAEEAVSDGAGVPGRDVLSYCRENGWFDAENPAQNVSVGQTFEDMLSSLSDATAVLPADGGMENISGQEDLLPAPELLHELKREFDALRSADEAWLVLPAFGQDGHATGMYAVGGKTYVHVTASEGMSDVAAAWAAHLEQNSAPDASDHGDR